jgi:hypothetical protein
LLPAEPLEPPLPTPELPEPLLEPGELVEPLPIPEPLLEPGELVESLPIPEPLLAPGELLEPDELPEPLPIPEPLLEPGEVVEPLPVPESEEVPEPLLIPEPLLEPEEVLGWTVEESELLGELVSELGFWQDTIAKPSPAANRGNVNRLSLMMSLLMD